MLFVLAAPASAQAPPPSLPVHCRQAVLVIAKSWDDSTGRLQRWERQESGTWMPVGDPWPVQLGRNGLAWGRGLHVSPPHAPEKKEGDGKAPSGIFIMGPAFGHAPTPPPGVRLPWRQATAHDYFVDDPEAPEYNRWANLSPGAPPRWKSAERMQRSDALYEFGAVVQHNMAPVVPGAGSAIFLHVWAGPERSTAGCTAMVRDALIDLLRWLDPEKNPVLVQAPLEAWSDLRIEGGPP